MSDRQHIVDAINADARQDTLLATYAEHGRASDLVAAIETAYEILEALVAEAEDTGKSYLVRRNK